jgi:3-oxoacyl-[acyl-carrier-protein] synthase-3
MNLERIGNMSSATIPVLLDELNREGRIKEGDRIVMSGFGAGLTYGASVLVW